MNDLLLMAAKNGDVQVLVALLQRGADVDARNEDEETALLVAADHGHLEAVAVLLQHGADVNAPDFQGYTPLMAAASSRVPEIVALLLERGADTRPRNIKGRTALLTAHWCKDTEALEVFRTHQKELDLNEAAALGDAKAFFERVTAGADQEDAAPLLLAVRYGHPEWVPQLLDRGMSANAATSANWTALMWAARSGDLDLVKLLTSRGADPSVKYYLGQTALDIAEEYKQKDVVEFLNGVRS